MTEKKSKHFDLYIVFGKSAKFVNVSISQFMKKTDLQTRIQLVLDRWIRLPLNFLTIFKFLLLTLIYIRISLKPNLC